MDGRPNVLTSSFTHIRTSLGWAFTRGLPPAPRSFLNQALYRTWLQLIHSRATCLPTHPEGWFQRWHSSFPGVATGRNWIQSGGVNIYQKGSPNPRAMTLRSSPTQGGRFMQLPPDLAGCEEYVPSRGPVRSRLLSPILR